jgi:hypothetical protein
MRNSNTILISFLFFSTLSFGQDNNKTPASKQAVNDALADTTEMKYDSIPFSKTSEMLDEETYWGIIDNSIKGSTNKEDQEVFLISEIEKLTPKEIVGFRLRTDKLLYDTYSSEMWCAAYLMNKGCSDNGFEYFRCWVISRGKSVYYDAKSNPDSLVKEIIEGEQIYEFESFWYVAMASFINKTSEELYPYIDYDNFLTNEDNYPLISFNWNEENPDSLKNICPVLFEKLGK